MKQLQYSRKLAVDYAEKWAYSRNPSYYNYDSVGGDCTNFISQCIFAGSNVMNYNKNNGWYYINGNNKSPSWTGVEFLNKFLISNNYIGPYGVKSDVNNLELGDIVQLSFDGKSFTHSLIIVKIDRGELYISSHTFDSFNRKISSYDFKNIRFVHIEGVRNF